MEKLIWHTMMSLDGYIAGRDDDMDWVFGVDGGSGETVAEVLRSTGALLVGRRTQDVEDRLQPGFYGGAFSGPSSCSGTIPRPSLQS
jgi:RibD C-terminal domain